MKHSLQLRLSQHLTLTPQLQQSIRLLQLSTLELNQEIEQLLQDNPLLEREDGTPEQPVGTPPSDEFISAPTPVDAGTASNEDSTDSGDNPFEEDFGFSGGQAD